MTTLAQALHDARIGCDPCDHVTDAERLTEALKPDAAVFTVESLAAALHTPPLCKWHDHDVSEHRDRAAAIIGAAKEADRE